MVGAYSKLENKPAAPDTPSSFTHHGGLGGCRLDGDNSPHSSLEPQGGSTHCLLGLQQPKCKRPARQRGLGQRVGNHRFHHLHVSTPLSFPPPHLHSPPIYITIPIFLLPALVSEETSQLPQTSQKIPRRHQEIANVPRLKPSPATEYRPNVKDTVSTAQKALRAQRSAGFVPLSPMS